MLQVDKQVCDTLDRGKSIGSTIIGQVMKTSFYGDTWDAFLALTGQADDLTPTLPMEFGVLGEPVMIKRCNSILVDEPERFGLTHEEVKEFGLHFVPCDTASAIIEGVPCRATPDAVLVTSNGELFIVDGGCVLLECKVRFWADKDLYENGAPASDYDQCQWHMTLTDGARCFVIAWFGIARDVEIFRVDRDDKRIRECLDAAFDFWHFNVMKNNPPTVNGSTACKQYLARQEEREASRREFQNDEWALATDIAQAKEEIATLKERIEMWENMLRESMGETQELYVEGGKSKVTCKKPKNRETRTLRVSMKD